MEIIYFYASLSVIDGDDREFDKMINSINRRQLTYLLESHKIVTKFFENILYSREIKQIHQIIPSS